MHAGANPRRERVIMADTVSELKLLAQAKRRTRYQMKHLLVTRKAVWTDRQACRTHLVCVDKKEYLLRPISAPFVA